MWRSLLVGTWSTCGADAARAAQAADTSRARALALAGALDTSAAVEAMGAQLAVPQAAPSATQSERTVGFKSSIRTIEMATVCTEAALRPPESSVVLRGFE